MFEKKKKATKKNEDLMKKAPAAGAVELGDDVLEAAAGGYELVYRPGSRVPGGFSRPARFEVKYWTPECGLVVQSFSSKENALSFVERNGLE